ncbi:MULTISPECIES: hypothetical protein [Haloferax]|uniref:DUF7965 domain-containing protein n=1 Tax=Haloferax marinum TaxID=2666143 RepID=A0A6A8G2D9_9EURY|nr:MULTISPECIES: hypothetical protein [Haloferax]KAB1196314.1 hypothetical protein Hfx1150_01790 [Haloferax sp. CBA1150]MRW95304.1 hypothetical protein [Haloferax marinum]
MASTNTLEMWAVATFNVVVFGVLGVIAVHVSGELAGLLRGLSTLEGVLVFTYLWALTFAATRWALEPGGLERIQIGEFSSLLVRGALAGALIGAGFLIGVVLVEVAVRFVFEPVSLPGVQVGSFVFIVSAGGGIAALVGGVVGVVFVLFDVFLYRLSMYVGSRTSA